MNDHAPVQRLKELLSEEPDEQLVRKRYSTRLGHIKRKLIAGDKLEGKLLELVLELIPADDPFTKDVPCKLRKGEALTDYELHILVDVILLHAKLSGP